jgi:hypothetical protein
MAQFSPLSGSPTEQPFPSPALPVDATSNAPPMATATTNTNTTTTATATATKPKSKPRKRVNTAEKRHQHNAIERQRRETLNGKFFDLARLLPALASSRRPSKSAIVNGSIAHLTYQRDQRLLASRLLKQLSAERDAMAKELNEWRASGGFQPREITNLAEEVEEVCSVEQEVFGTFANVDDEPEDDDMTSEVPSFHGLITPRPSADMNEIQVQSMFAIPPVSAPAAAPAPALAQTWSNDFTFALNTSNVFPFNPFLADPVEPATSTSPASSQQGGVLTPQTFTEMMVNHTPSPRSSTGLPAPVEEVKPAMQAPQNNSASWTPAQILLAHQQAQAQLQRQQQQQQGQTFRSNLTPPPVSTPAPLNSDLFSQQLMASMFANSLSSNNNAHPDQIELWRRAAIGSIPQMPMSRPALNPNPTSVHDLRVS